MFADKQIAIQFIKDIAKHDVSTARFTCREHDGCIEFRCDDADIAADPMPLADRITRNLGVRRDMHVHNGIEFAWDMPHGRRMFFVAKEWGEIQFGLLDFKAGA